ncbi:hypothetical protein Tco_0194827 [Tanacetum coccineum]
MALSDSAFCKRYRSSYETPSPSPTLPDTEDDADDERESQGLDDEGQGLEDEGPGMEEAAPEDQQQAVSAMDTTVGEPLGLGYGALRRRELTVREYQVPSTFEVGQSSRSVPEQQGAERVSASRQPTLITWVDPEDGRVYTDILTYAPPVAPVHIPPSPEWSSCSLPVSPSSPIVPSPIASPVATPTSTISVDEDQRLDALPPALFEGIDKDVRDLYTRSGAVRDEIFSQRYRFRSLKQEQERATMTFSVIWRPRENHDLRRQIAEERRERLELTDRVARIERR